MTRTVEESVINVKPSKSYMAISTSIPKVGEYYNCKRLEKNSKGELIFRNTKTSTVQKIKKLASNVFVVVTRNSYYVTRVLYMPVENVHFAIVKNEPQNGSEMYCYKMKFRDEKSYRCVNLHTTTVQKIERIHGLYKVKTNNSVYICFPM